MNKVTNFLDLHFSKIATILLVLIFLNTCGSGDVKSINKRLDKLTEKVDESVTKKDLQIEGLKTEKRMIQSTDRKILDVNRQSVIDKEIEKLSK
jgi:hypothetical protein